jgi:hypothetical protein
LLLILYNREAISRRPLLHPVCSIHTSPSGRNTGRRTCRTRLGSHTGRSAPPRRPTSHSHHIQSFYTLSRSGQAKASSIFIAVRGEVCHNSHRGRHKNKRRPCQIWRCRVPDAWRQRDRCYRDQGLPAPQARILGDRRHRSVLLVFAQRTEIILLRTTMERLNKRTKI